jgi:hypothetical protein
VLAKLRSRLTYANVVATLALFVALGGGSYAAITITGKNVKNSSLTGKDIKNSSLTSSDVKNRSLLSKDFQVRATAGRGCGGEGSHWSTGIECGERLWRGRIRPAEPRCVSSDDLLQSRRGAGRQLVRYG